MSIKSTGISFLAAAFLCGSAAGASALSLGGDGGKSSGSKSSTSSSKSSGSGGSLFGGDSGKSGAGFKSGKDHFSKKFHHDKDGPDLQEGRASLDDGCEDNEILRLDGKTANDGHCD